jgi:hypothetical protein
MLLWPAVAFPCSYGRDQEAAPEVDLGVVEGVSPPPPIITSVIQWTCDHENEDSVCCGPLLVVHYDGTDAELFSLSARDSSAFVRPLRPGTLEATLFYVGPSEELRVVAWKPIGYRSEPVTFLVEDHRTYESGGGCNGAGGAPSLWVLAGAVGLVSRRKRFTGLRS